MGVIQRFIDRNKEFASKFRHGDKAMPPAHHLAVVTCMDARIHPEQALGLEIGDAHLIRNAGGRASDDALQALTPQRAATPSVDADNHLRRFRTLPSAYRSGVSAQSYRADTAPHGSAVMAR